MAKKKFIIDLKLNSIKIKDITTDLEGDYHIYAACTTGYATCHKCNNKITHSHGQCKETIIEHLPVLDQCVFIHVKWPRYICNQCDDHPTTSFKPDWLNETGQLTKAYENFYLKFLINSTIKDVSEKLGTTEAFAEGIVNRRIEISIDWNTCSPRVMGIDEIALRKGHSQYLTIITDLSDACNIKLLAVLKGRSKDEVLPFLKTIPRRTLLAMEAITIDMGASYFSALKDLFDDDDAFNKIVTIDRFHVAKLLGDKVDKERKKVINKLKKDFENNEDTLNELKNTMWPFRHHLKDLDDDEENRLDYLFGIDSNLEQCHELREDFFYIFENHDFTKESAKYIIDDWISDAEKYETKGFNPFTSFIKTYRNFEENILNYFTGRVTSGAVEGLNNKIKVVKRRGYGFINIENFARRLFLDINYKSIFL
jgi:transposase